jgi:ligand-binding sensor domain-containing protein
MACDRTTRFPRDGSGEDLNHHIWIAGGQGRLSEFIDGRWSSALHRRTAGSASSVEYALATDYRDSQGNIWRCEMAWHSGSGLVRYMDLPPGTQPASIVFNTLFEDREGNIWLSTDGQGLYRVRNQTINVY